MMANNEIGTIQPIQQIGSFVREERERSHRHLWFHTDAVQAVGKVPVDVNRDNIDILS